MPSKKYKGPGKGLVGGRYKPLSEIQVQQIHNASLQILERTGVKVNDPQVLHLFQEIGADVEEDRVRLPSRLVEDAVDKAPSSIILAGRDPENDLLLEGARVYLGTGGAALKVLDLEDGKIRSAVLHDVADMARVVDALYNIHFYLIPIYPTDLPLKSVEINKFYQAITNTTKHVQAGMYTIEGIRDVVEMSEKIVGGANELRQRPIVSFITSWMVSPLTFATGVTRLLMEVCRQGIPVVLSSAPTAGLTAPVTLAGLLAQLNAEQLAGLALTQMIQPGCPVLLGPVPGTSDLRSGKYLGGSVEDGLCNAAITQMAHYYKIPIYNSAGLTDSKIPDIQAGIEKAQSVMQVALAGANFIHHAAGLLEDMSTIAYEQFVIDNELLGMAMRAVKGIQVDGETLALDTIDNVGPGGHYLIEKHTLRHMHTEHYYISPVFDRQLRGVWEKAGATAAWDRAKKIASQILGDHTPQPIDREIDKWIHNKYSALIDL